MLPCWGGEEREERSGESCLHYVTNTGKDQGLSSPRFPSEICGCSEDAIHDMFPLLIDPE